jgi:hypothetical protein
MQRVSVLLGSLAAVLVLGTTPLSAQVTVGADAGIFSAYVWRGLSLVNRPVAQPDLYVTLPAGRATFTAGGWANMELGRYDRRNDISEGGGTGFGDVTEVDYWGEVNVPVGKVNLAGGLLGYAFPNPRSESAFNPDINTLEAYARLGLNTLLSPKLGVWYDVDEVKGAYIEASIAQSIPLTARVPLNLGALAGFSAGQEFNDSRPEQLYNFQNSGLTHVDLSAGTAFIAGPLTIAPVVHFLINHDDLTKVTSLSKTDESVKFWLGTSLSWSHAYRAPKPPENESK